jgi:alkenylglycerophosphocholine/alkenylglycerophosphoethanolamine hydrolase
MTPKYIWTAVTLALAAAAAFCVGVAQDDHALRMLSKPWPVAIMIVLLAMHARHRYGRLVTVGLVFCLAGDILLEVSDAMFLAGVGSFLVGHLFYTAAYLGRRRTLRPGIAAVFLAWGVGVFAVLRPGLAQVGMTVPVAVYTAAICVMLWRAGACWEPGRPSAVTLLAFGGAVLFASSDTLIALDRFHAPIPGVRYVIILLYWLGQVGITLSAWRR